MQLTKITEGIYGVGVLPRGKNFRISHGQILCDFQDELWRMNLPHPNFEIIGMSSEVSEEVMKKIARLIMGNDNPLPENCTKYVQAVIRDILSMSPNTLLLRETKVATT